MRLPEVVECCLTAGEWDYTLRVVSRSLEDYQSFQLDKLMTNISEVKPTIIYALFALALQLGLSFGHTHANVAVAGISASGSQSQASTPDADHDQDVHHDLCAICATIAMANTLVSSAPPSLPVPERMMQMARSF